MLKDMTAEQAAKLALSESGAPLLTAMQKARDRLHSPKEPEKSAELNVPEAASAAIMPERKN